MQLARTDPSVVYVFLAVAALAFVICFRRLDVVAQLREAVGVTRHAHDIVGSASLTDQAKEIATQQAAIAMARLLVVILGRVALCLLVPAAAVWLGVQSGAYSPADAVAAASNWMFIATTSVTMVAALIIMR